MSSAQIRIDYADGRVREQALREGAHLIGREAGDIVLGDPNVSTRHAQIEVRGGQVTITDLGSTNGTYDSAGARLSAPQAMRPHEAVRLGECRITLLAIDTRAPAPGVQPQSPPAGGSFNPYSPGGSPMQPAAGAPGSPLAGAAPIPGGAPLGAAGAGTGGGGVGPTSPGAGPAAGAMPGSVGAGPAGDAMPGGVGAGPTGGAMPGGHSPAAGAAFAAGAAGSMPGAAGASPAGPSIPGAAGMAPGGQPGAPPAATASSAGEAQVVGVGDWLITFLILSIPLVNFVMLVVWAFGGGAAASKMNWARAALIWMLIWIGLGILFVIVFSASMASLFNGLEAQ